MMLPTGAIISLAIAVPLVLLALPRVRLGIYRRVLVRREPRTLCRSEWASSRAASSSTSRSCWRFVSLVLDDSARSVVGIQGAARQSSGVAARHLDRGDRDVLLVFGHERRSLHPSDRDGRSGAHRHDAHESHRG
jgi:hypothetical protein